MFRFFRSKSCKPNRKPTSRFRPAIEPLEGRCLMAFSVLPPDANGLVQMIGTKVSDVASITVNPSSITIAGKTYASSSVKAVAVGGKAGNDIINVSYAPASFSYNPTIQIWGDENDDKVEISNGIGKNVFAHGGSGSDRIALHGVAFLGQGRQLGFEKFWTDAMPQQVAQAFLNRNVSELKLSGDLPMSTWPANNVNCANFVSATLEVTGRITAGQHQDSVSGLADKLVSLGWKRVAVSQARPGDVWIDKSGGRSHTELVLSNTNGKVTLIGANNINADGSQRISTDASSFRNSGSYLLTPP